MDLFIPIVPPDKLNKHFVQMSSGAASEPARMMAKEVFHDFSDPDGNFVEQFQTTGFDSRIFELYLYAYFSKSGYSVNRDFDKPDFLVTKDGFTVAVEATTINPSQFEERKDSRHFQDLSEDELQEKFRNEVPIRFGGPLFSKLNKKYWELEHCQGMPLVIAIEAFHEEMALHFSDSSLGQYLYGLRHFPEWSEDGHLIVRSQKIETHQWGQKVIPSNFFGQPETEKISAVIFSNSGTYAKFLRMGFKAGYHKGNLEMIRRGTCYDHDPDATKPLLFEQDVSDPLIKETWGNGLTVYINPNAKFPLPKDYFVDAAQGYIEDGQMKTDVPAFHPYMSVTQSLFLNRTPYDRPEGTNHSIQAIFQSEFMTLATERKQAIQLLAIEKEFFTDKNRVILGCLFQDRADKDWNYVILGRDGKGVFRWIDGDRA